MEQILKNELNRQIALRVKEKIDRMLGVYAYLSKEDVIKLINNVLNNVSNDFDKKAMLSSITIMVYCYLDDYDIVNQFIVNKDRVSKEIFEEMNGGI